MFYLCDCYKSILGLGMGISLNADHQVTLVTSAKTKKLDCFFVVTN